jgi:thioredoxin
MKRFYFLTVLSVFCLGVAVAAPDESLSIKEFADKIYQAKHPQILDARSPEEFSNNRIKGAVNADLADSIGLKKLIAQLDPNNPTFTYSINSGRSVILANKLRALGFKQVYALPGGLANWVGAGYPLESSGKKGLSLTGKQFKQLTTSNELVLVDFGSKYCGGCRKLVPVLDSLEHTYSKSVKFVRIELDDNTEVIKEQKIEALPRLILYKNGENVWKNEGFISSSAVAQVINKYSK